MVSIKQVVIFESSKYKDEAKKFLSYLIEPENLKLYIQGSQGRFFPVMPQLLEDPFWQNSSDPHISKASQQFYRIRPFAQALNPAYSEVQNQNIWGKVIAEMVSKDLSAQEATDQAIAQIKAIFQDWQSLS
jgi:multiple sugar transport system substrate-binding protein